MAREFELSLPHELTDEQRAHLAFAIAEALVDRYQFAVQASIHCPGTPDGLNHHVHLLASTRRIGPEGFGEKTRELDGGPSGKVQVQWVREMVAETTNAHLEAAGLTVTIDHRSLAEQARASDRGDEFQAVALSREPTKHLGKAATALSRKGMESRLVAENDAIEGGNAEHLDHLTIQAGREGRVVPMHASVGHGPGGRPPSIQGLAPGLEIRGVSGMRLSQVLGRQHEATEGQRPVSLAERVAPALRDLQDIARARADLSTQRVRAGLEWAQAELARAGEAVPLREWITKAVLQVRALRAAIVGRALRLVSLGRAERLHHLAQHEWERFNTDYPMGTNGYSRPEWTQRRERCLSTLEQRTKELERARLRGSAEALAGVDSEILCKAVELEAMPLPFQIVLERQTIPSVDCPAPVFKPKPSSLQ